MGPRLPGMGAGARLPLGWKRFESTGGTGVNEPQPLPTPLLVDLLFEKADVGLCLAAPDGSGLRANAEWRRMTGRGAEGLDGGNALERLGLSRDAAEALLARARAGETVPLPRRALSASDRVTWWEGSLAPVRLEEGIGLLLSVREEEPPAAAARTEALRVSERVYRAIGEAIDYGVWVCEPDGRNIYASESFLKLVGITQQQCSDFGWGEVLHPDDAERTIAAWKECVRTGGTWDIEHRFRGVDGQWHPVLARGVPVRNDRGEIACWAGINLDIARLKEAEARARASEEGLRLALLAGSMATWDWDVPGERVIWNDEHFRMLGYDVGAVVPSYEAWARRVLPEDLPAAEAALRRALDGEGDYNAEFRTVRSDGSHRWIEARGRVDRDPSGRPLRCTGVMIDVTEHRHAVDALRDADRRKNEFLGVLSHELRNPLAPIRNSIYLLERAAPDSPPAARAREVIRRQTEHLSRLVDDLLDVTRISSGKIELRRTRLDLCELVRAASEDHRSLFVRGAVELRLDLPAERAWVDGDATRLSQVIGNLLQNAAKFTPAGGRVVVGVRAAGRRAEVFVRDTGVGMEPDQVERMFEPFAQAERSLARTKGGLGLGLALAKGLVELHGGTIRAHSEGPGRGAEFRVALPGASEPSREASPGSRAAGGQGRLVLVVEDNVDAGQSLADLLEMQGHRVVLARDGRSGIALARSIRPDVVLCDLGLPDVDGFEVARILRRDEALRTTRLVALSGYAQAEDQRSARAAGFDAHLSKPPPLDALEAIVEGEPGRPAGSASRSRG
jgi:PAS domain S-box-containing protein